ncbi:hypothetical protein LTR56_022350 [Elasticomyces elasticus]|nr:hypothetical protein LTR56_022350 [Elasticomyces elasticus]KAK5737413.1 hypothetical protein LTS12_025884 [Elasticomyces elasticus]
MRQSIDRHPERLKSILMDAEMRKSFLDNAPNNNSKAVKAFVESNAGNALKTKPKGYDATHTDIDLLRLRNYTIGRKLKDDEVLDGMDRIANLLACMKPFITFINSVIMPDDADSDDSGSASGTSNENEDVE